MRPASPCLLVGPFGLFTFKVIIGMCTDFSESKTDLTSSRIEVVNHTAVIYRFEMHFPFGYFCKRAYKCTQITTVECLLKYLLKSMSSQLLYQEASDYNSSNTTDSLMK